MKALNILWCLALLLTLRSGCASKVGGESDDALIPSDSLFSSEENETNSDNYRQFLPPFLHPQGNLPFPGQNLPYLNPAYLNQGPGFGQFPTIPQFQQFAQQTGQSQIESSGTGSKRKKDKQGGDKRRRKRPQQQQEEQDKPLSDISQFAGYHLPYPDEDVSTRRPPRRKKKPALVPQASEDDYDVDYGQGSHLDLDLRGHGQGQGPSSVKKQLNKKKNKGFLDAGPETTDLGLPADSKTIGDEERACPVISDTNIRNPGVVTLINCLQGCVSGACNTNNVISGFPLIQIIAAVKAGIIWAGIFLFLYKNFIATGSKKGHSEGWVTNSGVNSVLNF